MFFHLENQGIWKCERIHKGKTEKGKYGEKKEQKIISWYEGLVESNASTPLDLLIMVVSK